MENELIGRLSNILIGVIDSLDYQEEEYKELSIESIEECVGYAYRDSEIIEESLMEDNDYKLLDTEEEKEKYIEDNYDNRLSKLMKLDVDYMYNKIEKEYKKRGYDVYEGEFFPYKNGFKSLCYKTVAFIKR